MGTPKGQHASPATEFRKGMVSFKTLPVGTVTHRKDKQGTMRAWIKIAEPNIWRPRAAYVWTVLHGPIPDGWLVHHKDHDALNDDPDNLSLLTRSEHRRVHEEDLRIARQGMVMSWKEVTCAACGMSTHVKKRDFTHGNFCAPCAKQREDACKRRYRMQHPHRIPQEQRKTRRFYEGEIWLIQRLLATQGYSMRFIAKMFLTCHTAIAHHRAMHAQTQLGLL